MIEKIEMIIKSRAVQPPVGPDSLVIDNWTQPFIDQTKFSSGWRLVSFFKTKIDKSNVSSPPFKFEQAEPTRFGRSNVIWDILGKISARFSKISLDGRDLTGFLLFFTFFWLDSHCFPNIWPRLMHLPFVEAPTHPIWSSSQSATGWGLLHPNRSGQMQVKPKPNLIWSMDSPN